MGDEIDPMLPTTTTTAVPAVTTAASDGVVTPSTPTTTTPAVVSPVVSPAVVPPGPVVPPDPAVPPAMVIDKDEENAYATKKTLAQGLLDIGLLIANAAQMKSLITLGPEGQDFFWPSMVFIVISIILQCAVGVVLLFLGNIDVTDPKLKKRAHFLNDMSVIMVAAITIVNTFIGAFGMKISDE